MLVSGHRVPGSARLPDPCAQVAGLVRASDPAIDNLILRLKGHCILLQKAVEITGILNEYCCVLQYLISRASAR